MTTSRRASSVEPSDRSRMARMVVGDPLVLVLADGATPAAVNHARGELFEWFVARLLHAYGYDEPTTANLKTTSEGIEIDIEATHRLTKQPAIVECKAYSRPVSASEIGIFHSKLVVRRYSEPNTHGFFVALPRLTSQGAEQVDLIKQHDHALTTLVANDIVNILNDIGEVNDCPVTDGIVSDRAVIVTREGIYSACLELNEESRKPARLLVWAPSRAVPDVVQGLIASSPYSQGVPVVDAREVIARNLRSGVVLDNSPVIVTVAGSRSDFEYQLPASPRYFVGRKRLISALEAVLVEDSSVLVLNAQSGWGKSSLALKLQHLANERGGHSIVVDSRTANSPRFVAEVLSRAASEAARKSMIVIPEDASWATLSSSLRTLENSRWASDAGRLIVFFDQFENVFRNEMLTREFRDLALGVRDLSGRLLIGFAWKTDHVGWTEDYPYQLRDDIRSQASVLSIGPLGATEIETLLRRLERELKQSLAKDLKQRLREYSQGLPWLFKKLAGHLLREVAKGVTQEKLASEALNVQSLFDEDLSELSPGEQEGLKHIARYAPIAISEVMDRIPSPVVTTLLHRRLVVQVGERLDTYWDIFRDYLNTGRVPVEDSYILRQTPLSVARLLREVVADDGDGSVPDMARRLGTSENALFNLSRELRLMGATVYESNRRVRLLDDIWNADDRESELRRRVAQSLRRHRAYTTFTALAERVGRVTASIYARDLPSAFPAVEVTSATWQSYARAFLLWFEYAGLAVQQGQAWEIAPEGSKGSGILLSANLKRRTKGGFPHEPPRPSLAYLLSIAANPSAMIPRPSDKYEREKVRPLLVLGILGENADGTLRLLRKDILSNGAIDQNVLMEMLERVPGVAEGLLVLRQQPGASPDQIGSAVKEAIGAEWAAGTITSIGKYLRGWAKVAGIKVAPVARAVHIKKADKKQALGLDPLF
ncbi:restriction endonuclease [Streptosporangium saharense]|uniref:nSTAND1 domain-containing NTPase n=1 Tax=Streptosporangium saharense TaxID=1706840 RepID=UPI0036A1B208